MTDSAWLARYEARKRRATPAPPPPPQPQYAPQPTYGAPQPPPRYYPPQPPAAPPPPPPQAYAPQPVGPPHAPFGYDPATGVPVAPYGRDQYGNILVQPPYAPPPGYPPQQPMHDPRGQVMPMGYGQPPYGSPQPGYGQPQPDPSQLATFVDENGQTHVDWSKAPTLYQGGEGNQKAHACPNCHKGFIVPTDASVETRVLNTRTGEFAYPASHCAECGYSEGGARPGETTGAMVSGMGGIKQGPARLAPGAGSVDQVQQQSGMGNLFAPRIDAA